jgi:phosphoribosylformylglycinamidine synthase
VRGCSGSAALRLAVADLESAWRGSTAPPAGAASASEQAAHPTHPAAVALTPASPRVIILHANGINRDREVARACEWAGGLPEIVHVNQLLTGTYHLLDYHMLVLPGGFSYGDTLGAGTLWALDMRHRLEDEIQRFARSGRPVIGICNGFQALVKAGLLPGWATAEGEKATRRVTLAANASGHFECRWVHLRPQPGTPCIFTEGVDDLIACPVAHGEGRLMVSDEATLARLQRESLVALTYVNAAGEHADYPDNPNGSIADIAGLCNPSGTILGLMPHPEDHIFRWQHPRWQRGVAGMPGLPLFINGVRACKR